MGLKNLTGIRQTTVPAVFALLLGGLAATMVAKQSPLESKGELRAQNADFQTNPLPGGKESDFDAAVSVSFTTFLPSDELASRETVRSTWIREDDAPTLLVDYDSGVRVTQRPYDQKVDPKELYSGLIADGVPGTLGTVLGEPAMLIEAERDGDDPASIDFVLEGTRVSIIGHGGQSVEELLKVANSMVTPN